MESFEGKYLNVLQMLSKVPIKCPVTEVLYDSPKVSGNVQHSIIHKKNPTRRNNV
jgi:hypothetical protein